MAAPVVAQSRWNNPFSSLHRGSTDERTWWSFVAPSVGTMPAGGLVMQL